MGYSRAQWSAFAAMAAANGLAVLLLDGRAHVGTTWLVVYAALVPAVFLGVVAASGGLKLRKQLRAASVLRAMTRGEIVLYYQPMIALDGGRVLAAEALARWEHPRRGVVPPADWLWSIEGLGWLERRFFRYTMRRAAEQAQAWRRSGRDLKLSVNVSPCALADAGLPRFFARLLEEWDLPGSAFELEVTEEGLGQSGQAVTVALSLADLGVAFAIDDFGTGYASMERLVHLPFSTLKVDRSFVTGMLSDVRKNAVVRSVCALGQSLDLMLVAEGIETVAVMEALRRLGCDLGQGYLFSRPVPAEAFDRWLEDRSAGPAAAPVGLERRTNVRRGDDRRGPMTAGAGPAEDDVHHGRRGSGSASQLA